MNKIKWQDSIWFFDIDDTLIDTAGTSSIAAEGIQKIFQNHFDKETADRVVNEYNNIFDYMLAGYRAYNNDWSNVEGGEKAFDEFLDQIGGMQKQVLQDYGSIKKWSREVFLKMAADRLNIEVAPEIIHNSIDEYWISLTEKTKIFDDALLLFEIIHKHKSPICLVTSSEARLKMEPDGQFIYNPEYSKKLKAERIEILKGRGLDYNSVIIGDPIDKPEVAFFQEALDTARNDSREDNIVNSNCIMVGDSFDRDLRTPKEKLDFGLVVLYELGQEKLVEVEPGFITTGDLWLVTNFIE